MKAAPETGALGAATERAFAAWGMDCSNSHSSDKKCRFSSTIGVDTVSWCWPGADPVDRLLRLDGLVVGEDRRPLRVVNAPGRSVRLSRRVDGLGTVGAFPAASLLYLEGRAAALETRDETNHALAPIANLMATQRQVSEQLSDLLGAPLDSLGAIRRVDLSGELYFDRAEDGQALMRVLKELYSPRYKTSVVYERNGPGIETVYWRTPGRNVPVLRAYDKGRETETAELGERIRIERQLRYGGAKRPSLSQFLTNDLGEAYVLPLRQWLTDGFVAGTASQLHQALTDACLIWPNYWSSGSSWCSTGGRDWSRFWTPPKVANRLGNLSLLHAYGAQWPPWTDRQRQRNTKAIRDLGLLLLDHPIQIDAHALVTGLCDEWRQAA